MAADDFADTSEGKTAALDEEALLKRLKNWFRQDARHSADWRKEAKDYYGFIAGEQWTAAEKAALSEQLRPVIVFNRALSIIKSIAGSEINGRQEIKYLPVENSDTKLAEFLSAVGKCFADKAEAEDEESDAFQDALITGMGWTESRLDFEENPDADYAEDRIDPLEMFWDASTKKKNLRDARRVWRKREVPLLEANVMFPDFDDADLDASWARLAEVEDPKKSVEEKRSRDQNTDDPDDKKTVTLVHGQWWEKEPYWLLADPKSGERVEMTEEDYQVAAGRLKKLKMPVKAVKMHRKVYKQAWIGDVVLEQGEVPCKDHFSYQCITGERDRNNGTWFGLVKVLHDPQKWANKWLSQTLHILNTTAKGGILAEKNAFEDQRQAEETFAKPEAITWVRNGALSGANPGIMPKPASQFPAGYIQLMEFAVSSIRDTTGINLELLGMRDANQPGILEAQRKQAAMTILATMFDSLRRYRKAVGRIRLYFIQNNLSDGRLIRIVGEQGAETLPLVKDKTAGKYDVVVDDSPSSPNQKEANWTVISQMLPAFKDKLEQYPELAIAVLENSPLPSAFVDAVRKAVEKPNPQAEKQQQIAEATAIGEIDKTKSEAEKNRAQAMQAGATAENTAVETDQQKMLTAVGTGLMNGAEQKRMAPPMSLDQHAMSQMEQMASMMMQTVSQAMQAMAQSTAAMQSVAQSVAQSSAMAAAPKRVIKDDLGQVVGIAPDPSMMQ